MPVAGQKGLTDGGVGAADSLKFIVPQRKPAVGKSTVVSVRLPDTMLAKLEDVASRTGRSRNELVQMCIDYALARLEITEE